MPNLNAGQTYTARVTLSNPTTKTFSYTAELMLGPAATSGIKSFSIPGGQEVIVPFPITMPMAEGTFPVLLDIKVGGVLVAAYQGKENVTTIITPEVVVGPIVWG